MQSIFIYLFKIIKYLRSRILTPFDYFMTSLKFYSNGIQYSSIKTFGVPIVNVSIGGKVNIGDNFRMNNDHFSNPIGRFNPCSLIVGENGNLEIGDNVGMSGVTIVCHNKIKIGSNVNLGGNVVVYDTDFHSLNKNDRLNRENDFENTKTRPVLIGDNVFIGGHSTILKGVKIGKNAIIGACSVVTKDIPENQIWAGNPAKFIR
ncbi:acyltransferase [Maribacter aquivivus]|uniref:acyltransferase n=1 Tax=Maribacter aquivivus TaxID=228958 RepID=UPI00249033D8|nr:acyltransferase [Maribacter aquivivus]